MNVKITNGPIRHDKIYRNVGDVLTVDDAAGKRLIDLGVAEVTDAKPAVTTPQEGQQIAANATQGSGKENPDEEGDGEGEGVEVQEITDIDAMSKDAIAQELSIRGIGYKCNAPHDKLVELLKKAIDTNG